MSDLLQVYEEQFNIVREINNKILTKRNIDQILQTSIDSIVNKLGLLGSVLLIVEDDHLYAKTIAGGNWAELFLKIIGKPIGSLNIPLNSVENAVVESINRKEKIYDPDLSKYTEGVLDGFLVSKASKLIGIRQNVCIPLFYDQEVIGAVVFASGENNFDKEIKALELLANSIAISYVNARLITEKDQALIELQQKVQELDEAYRQERDMIHILAHELRTPLSTARNALKMLAKDIVDPENNNYYQMLDRNLTREKDLLELILSASEIDSQNVSMNIEEINLNEFVKEIYADMKVNIKPKLGFELGLKTDEDVEIQADKNRLTEVLINTIDNANKYTYEGGIVLSTEKKDEFCVITISDTGIGIPQDKLTDIRKKFFRVHQHYHDKSMGTHSLTLPGGTGLGLYIVYEMVDLMGGKIKVESKENKGTNFHIYIPLATS